MAWYPCAMRDPAHVAALAPLGRKWGPRRWCVNGSPRLGRVSRWVLGAAIAWLALGCASQQQTGRALRAAGTAAVFTGAIVASNAGCTRQVPDDRYTRVYVAERGCQISRSGQNAGAAIAVAGLGAAAIGKVIEDDAKRAEAYKRGRFSANAPMVPMQAGVQANSILALPEAPFTPRNPHPPQQPPEAPGTSGEGEGNAPTPAEPAAPAEEHRTPDD
jgi:hypothetical protein